MKSFPKNSLFDPKKDKNFILPRIQKYCIPKTGFVFL